MHDEMGSAYKEPLVCHTAQYVSRIVAGWLAVTTGGPLWGRGVIGFLGWYVGL